MPDALLLPLEIQILLTAALSDFLISSLSLCNRNYCGM